MTGNLANLLLPSTIRSFVATLLRRNADTQPFSDSTSVLLSIESIAFLEEQFGMDLADKPFDRGQIDSADRVTELLGEAC